MKIVLEGDRALTLVPGEGMLTIEADRDDENYSSFHMIGSALALCTFTVLHSWAHHSNIEVSDLTLHVEWDFAEHPHRLSNMRTHIRWPSLPDARKPAAERAAALCAVHATLTHPVAIETVVNV